MDPTRASEPPPSIGRRQAPRRRAAGGSAEGVDRVLTVPNAVTLVRLLCIPLFVWLLFGAHDQTAAAVLLGRPRRHRLGRRLRGPPVPPGLHLGKVLDPAADRILVGTAVIAIIVYGAVPVWFGVATLAREVLVAGTVLVLAALGAARIDVLWVGKAGTFGLMFAYPAFLLGARHGRLAGADPRLRLGAGDVGLALAWVAAAVRTWCRPGGPWPRARRARHAGEHRRAQGGGA